MESMVSCKSQAGPDIQLFRGRGKKFLQKRYIDRQTQKKFHTHNYKHTKTVVQTEIHTQTQRYTDRQTHFHTHLYKHTQTVVQTEKF